MTILTSRIILGIEALVIGTPLSLLFVYSCWPVMFHDVLYSPTADAWALASVGIIILATLCCSWVLMFKFLLRGIVGLRSLSIYWWALPVITGAVSLAVNLHTWLAEVIEPSAINIFGWGIPLLIPLVHLLLERWLRCRGNNIID